VKDRPAGFKLAFTAVVLQCIFGFVGFEAAFPFGLPAAIFSCILCSYFFWRGRNWARIVIILVSATALLLLYPDFKKHRTVREIFDMINAPLALFLLYWCNTRPVKEYFRRASSSRVDTPTN
jgi:hypothetical protein